MYKVSLNPGNTPFFDSGCNQSIDMAARRSDFDHEIRIEFRGCLTGLSLGIAHNPCFADSVITTLMDMTMHPKVRLQFLYQSIFV